MKADRLEGVARTLVTIVPPVNGWWGVHMNMTTSLHQSEEAAVVEREHYVEWLTSILRREQSYQRAKVRRIIKAERKQREQNEHQYDWERGYVTACDDILAALNRRTP